jgi:hypothetical protein
MLPKDKAEKIKAFFRSLEIPNFFGHIQIGFQNGKAKTFEAKITEKLTENTEQNQRPYGVTVTKPYG